MAKPTRSQSEERPRKTSAPDEDVRHLQVRIQRLKMLRVTFPLVGVTPLIVHKWSQKAILEMLEKGGPVARKPKEKRDPEADYQAARYLLDQPRKDGLTDGVPAVAFKAAIVQAARAFEGVTMTSLKQFIYIEAQPPQMLIPIIGKPVRRQDPVRVGKGLNTTADIRHRPEYWPWSCSIVIRWPAAMFDAESILALVDAAGMGGICEWRPTAPKSLTGIMGQFKVDETAFLKENA